MKWVSQQRFFAKNSRNDRYKSKRNFKKNAYATAIKLIQDNKDLHIKIAEQLLKTEEINKEEFDSYFVKS